MREDHVVDLSDLTQITTGAKTRVRDRALTCISLLHTFFDILSPYKLCDVLRRTLFSNVRCESKATNDQGSQLVSLVANIP